MPPSSTPSTAPRSFDTEQDARAWMVDRLHQDGEHCIDDERFAFLDDDAGMAAYHAIRDGGCCGSQDEVVVINGRRAMIGCNYGH